MGTKAQTYLNHQSLQYLRVESKQVLNVLIILSGLIKIKWLDKHVLNMI